MIANGRQRIGFQFILRSKTPNGYSRWRFLLPTAKLDVLVVARMDVLNVEIMDYYVLPRRHLTGDYINLRLKNPALAQFHHIELERAVDAALGLVPSGPSIAGHA